MAAKTTKATKANITKKMEPKNIEAAKIPTMKKWGYTSWVATIIITIITIICCVSASGDTSTLGIICGLAWAETGVYTGCYAYKSKAENKLKITQGFIAETADKYGIEAVTPIIQSIIQE